MIRMMVGVVVMIMMLVYVEDDNDREEECGNISIKIAPFLPGKLSRASGDHHGHGCAEELTSRTAEWLGVAALKGQSDLENPIEIPYVG